MFARTQRTRRRGSILPLVTISLIAIFGFVAMAIDIGMLVVAKTQCQNAADAAAITGARSLDGTPSGNVPGATSNAQSAAAANTVLAQNVLTAEVSLQAGAYHYDPANQTFAPQFPPVPPDNFNVMQATVSHTVNYAFARVFNLTSLNVSATAIAAHRPRDVCIVLDFSGSMNNESDLWNCETYLGNMNGTSNNTDPIFPQWGQYDLSWSPLATMQCTSADPRVGKCNVTVSVLGVPPLVNDFYQNARGASAAAAFAPAPGGITNTNPGGDAAQNHVRYINDIPGGAPFRGYAATYNPPGRFLGYRQGPGYWGKTFFIWPPDPTSDSTINPVSPYYCDWRKRFFMKTGGSFPNFGGPVDDNTRLYSAGSGSGGGGIWNDPAGLYVINYRAILAWIRSSPTIFPPMLRAGNILYYDQIPIDVPSAAYDHTQPNRNIADPNQRFWKEYIDYTLGVWRDPLGNTQHPGKPACSIGGDFTCGSSTGGTFVNITGPDSINTYALDQNRNPVPFMSPTDNPKRPRHRFWFGPMTMIQFLSDTGLFPGTVHDISMIAAKLGIQGALTDVQNNHPNDLVSMLLFSRPHYPSEPAEVGAFSQAQFNLSRDYAGMINALYFPPNSGTYDVRPWDANGAQTPRAHGDYDSNTATSYGFMLAYNQLSSSSALRSQSAGGLGRRGSQRLIILETDGMANNATNATFTNSGPNNSYYNILPGDGFTFTDSRPAAATAATGAAQRLCALETDSTNGPGYATPRKPVILHCIAFGAIFEPTATGTEATDAMSLLQQLSTIGGTGFPPSVTATGDPNYYKLCIGTLAERQSKLRTAFSRIMDDGVSVVMIK